ncbi:MAG: nucleotide exchange factor GrpE [Candidatus Omnitrophota bacterium]
MDDHHSHEKRIKKNNMLLSVKEYESIQELAKKSEENFDRLLRLQADFDNYKKRVEKERIDFIKYANEDIIIEILKILDDFQRAHEAGKKKHDFEVLYKGVEMIYKDLKDFLSKKGVKEIESIGKPFDPNEHEAMMQCESDDVPEDHVIEEFQKGYMLNGRVIRPSKVKISKKPESNDK